METKSPLHFLSLIIPVYKKEKTIVKNLQTVQKVLNTIRYDYEIIAVVDGILDKSYQNIKKSKLKKVSVFAYKENQGKSYAIQLGMHKSNGDYIMFMDAGAEIDPNGISMLLEHMEWYNADIIVGSKRHPASLVNYPFMRRIFSYGYYFLLKLLFMIDIHDTQAGIKVFKKKVIHQILPRLIEKKFAGDLEMLVAAKTIGYNRIYEAPIRLDYTLDGLTKAATFKSIYGIFVDTMAIFYRVYFLDYYRIPHRKFAFPKDLKT